METFMIVFCWFSAVALLGCCWAFVVNERTHKQRMRLIEVAFADVSDWRHRAADLGRVGYFKHFWHLYALRNPSTLYSHPALVGALS